MPLCIAALVTMMIKHTGTERTARGFSLCCIAAGAVFLLFPGWVLGTLSLILGLLCASYGGWKLYTALRVRGFVRGGSLIGGAGALFLGIYIIWQPEQVFSLLPIAAGVFFLMDGVDRIRSAAAMHRTVKHHASDRREAAVVGKQKRRFYTACVIGVLTLLCGVFLLMRPFDALELTLRVVGGLILVNGIGALWTSHALNITLKAFGTADAPRRGADGKYEASFRDITDQ